LNRAPGNRQHAEYYEGRPQVWGQPVARRRASLEVKQPEKQTESRYNETEAYNCDSGS
jgi:hypothetical protein